MKTYIIIGAVIILVGILGAGAYFLTQTPSITINGTQNQDDTAQPQEQEQPDEAMDKQEENKRESVIGASVQERDIIAYHYGLGETELLFVGGIHGGYEWNTVLVAYELMDYLEANPIVIPENIKVTVIPVINPDGLEKIVGTAGRFTAANAPSSLEATVSGRFNANNVDLNRNFDCDWKSTATWKDREVDGGSKAFSEPESRAFRDYVQAATPDAVVVWYSAAGGVFASNCHTGVLPETSTITNVFADASGYPAYQEFNFYEITGDAVNWLAKNNIPAISVLLTTHTDVEWAKNRAGVEALLTYYKK